MRPAWVQIPPPAPIYIRFEWVSEMVTVSYDTYAEETLKHNTAKAYPPSLNMDDVDMLPPPKQVVDFLSSAGCLKLNWNNKFSFELGRTCYHEFISLFSFSLLPWIKNSSMTREIVFPTPGIFSSSFLS